MESYGELLKKTRTEQDISIEQVARDTAISHQYIEAMESESPEKLPGEAYFIGFLKTYSKYLHLDVEEVLKLYNAKKIQESPIPVQLLEKKKNKAIPFIILGSVVLILVALFFIFYFVILKVPEKRAEKKEVEKAEQKIHQYTFSGKAENKRLYRGDQILINEDDDPSKQIVLTVSQTQGYLAIETPVGEQIIELSEERELDINGDGIPDLIVYLSDVSFQDSSYGAEVRIMQKNPDLTRNISSIDSNGNFINEIPNESSNNQKYTVIHESSYAYPFVLNISFRGSSLFRYQIDNQPYVEDYYKSGDTINITATKQGFRLWMANVNALKIQIQVQNSTYDLEVGKGGQVVVEDIRWIHDTDGRYKIVLVDVD